MSENSAKLESFVSLERMEDINSWIAKYPIDQRQSAVMSTLRIVQEEHGHLTPELMDAVADYLNMPRIAVYEVASFYTMYIQEPVGKHLISVCKSISCKLKNYDGIVNYLEKKLEIKLGETTCDGRFTLRAVECLGACIGAPMMQVDNEYHEHLTTESIDSVLEKYQ